MEQGKKDYFNWKVIQFHRKTKERAVAYKGGGCELCGYCKCIASLQFHHRDPSQKDFQISGRIMRWERIQPELDKCQLLCSNCHGELHYAEREGKLQKLELSARSVVVKRAVLALKPCKVCSTLIKERHTFCSRKCQGLFQEKGQWPTNEELIKMFNDFGITKVSRRLGFSEKTLRKKRRQLMGA